MAQINFDFNSVQAYSTSSTTFRPLDEGEYTLQIVDCVDTDNGCYYVYEVVGGERNGFQFRDYINFNAVSQVGREISQRALKTLSIACGVEQLVDTAQLISRQFIAYVVINEYNGKRSNKVKKYIKPSLEVKVQDKVNIHNNDRDSYAGIPF